MPPRRQCLVCGSRQWHKEPMNGLVTCSEGHVLQNYRTEARTLDEYGLHTMKKRTIKSGRNRKERQSKADPQLYHGDRARYHYFQCLQLILRLQVDALVGLWELPPEFEIVCRDIWALHLSLLPFPLPAEPLLHRQDQDGEASKPKNLVQTRDEENAESDNKSGGSSTSSDGEVDPEMDALLQEISEQSSSDNEDQLSNLSQTEKVHKRRRRGVYDSAVNNIVVLVLACWTLRIPVLYMDFFQAIESYDLPYLDVMPLLPLGMRRHLTKQNVHALSPHFSPAQTILHPLASRLAKKLYVNYGIFTPEVNAAPVLWRAVRHLCGTATLYNISKKLAGILSLPLTLHHTLAPKLTILKKDDPESHIYDNLAPEVALIATVVVVLRLVYGLDGKQRSPRDPNDPACSFPVLSEYLTRLQDINGVEARERRHVFSTTTSMPVQELSEQTIDAYLDFCADKALSSGPENSSMVEEYFPLILQKRQTPLAPGCTEAVPLPTIPSNPKGDSLCPGAAYRIYHSRDVLGCVPEEYRLIVERAAHWTGVGDEYMFVVVERFERRFLRWWKTKQRWERNRHKSISGIDDLG